jgi:hypothetical protein
MHIESVHSAHRWVLLHGLHVGRKAAWCWPDVIVPHDDVLSQAFLHRTRLSTAAAAAATATATAVAAARGSGGTKGVMLASLEASCS